MMKKIFLFFLIILILSCSKQPVYFLELQIDTNYKDAQVFINGELAGSTPLKGEKIAIFTSAKIPVKVLIKKDFFRNHEFEFNPSVIEKNAILNGTYELIPGLEGYDGKFSKDGFVLPLDDLMEMNESELKNTQIEIRARFGAPIEDPASRKFFEDKGWYKSNPDYRDNLLSITDKQNLDLLTDLLMTEEESEKAENEFFSGIPGQFILGNDQYLFDPYDRLYNLSEQSRVEYKNLEYWEKEKLVYLYYYYKSFVLVCRGDTQSYTLVHFNRNNKVFDFVLKNYDITEKVANTFFNSHATIYNLYRSSYAEEEYDSNVYHPIKAFDNHPETAWIEGVDGPGKGECIQIAFYDWNSGDRNPILVDEVRIRGGFFDDRYFSANNRIKKAEIHYSENYETIEFEDKMEEQSFPLRTSRITYFTLEIVDVYQSENQSYNDTAISEISFYYKGKKINLDPGEYSKYLNVQPK